MPTWTIASKELSTAIRRMRPCAKGAVGAASWDFSEQELSIEWAGARVAVSVNGSESVTVRLSTNVMKGLLRRPFSSSDDITLQIENGRLSFDGFSVACEIGGDKVPQLLPMNAAPLDIALLPFRHCKEDIEAAGLTSSLVEIQEETKTATAKAAKHLRKLGIDDALLSAWIHAHLAAVAAGDESFGIGAREILLDKDGQIRLFDGE